MADDAADGVTVRPLSAEHFADFREIIDYGFHPTAGPQDYDDEPERIADRYGAFDGEDLVSICAYYDHTATLRGEWVPLAGLAAIATPPEHRRQGYVSALIDDALERWRGEYPLSALWPFDRSYYEQYGWATANTCVKFTCPPDQLAALRGAGEGQARPVSADEWRALQAVHEAQAETHTLALKRTSETWWRERVLHEGEDERPWAYAWERDGELRGYVVYEFTDQSVPDHSNRQLEVSDMAAADDDAWRGLVGFLADHDSQVSEILFETDGGTDPLDIVTDPGKVECELKTGPMARVVDVADALETCPYPDDAAADLTLAVTDDTADWNDGTFRLSIRDDDVECTPADVADPDATLDVGTVSQLVVGYHDVAAARRVGGLSVADENVADALAALFPTETGYLRTFF